jgi:hypothetical protein
VARAKGSGQKSYGLAVFLNYVFPGLGQVYVGAGRRAIPYLLVNTAGQILNAVSRSRHVTPLAVVATLVWLVTFILSIGNVQLAVAAGNWRPHGRFTKPFAITLAVTGAATFLVVTATHH